MVLNIGKYKTTCLVKIVPKPQKIATIIAKIKLLLDISLDSPTLDEDINHSPKITNIRLTENGSFKKINAKNTAQIGEDDAIGPTRCKLSFFNATKYKTAPNNHPVITESNNEGSKVNGSG